jgi:hypothetical protein
MPHRLLYPSYGTGVGAYFSINDVDLGPDGFVALTNFTDVPASLAGLYLCQGTQCFELPNQIGRPSRSGHVNGLLTSKLLKTAH